MRLLMGLFDLKNREGKNFKFWTKTLSKNENCATSLIFNNFIVQKLIFYLERHE